MNAEQPNKSQGHNRLDGMLNMVCFCFSLETRPAREQKTQTSLYNGSIILGIFSVFLLVNPTKHRTTTGATTRDAELGKGTREAKHTHKDKETMPDENEAHGIARIGEP